jgi:hypothetical protein
MEVTMYSKWLKIGMVATVAALVGSLALSATAFAQSGTPPAGGRYGAGVRGAWGGPNNSLVAVAAEVLGLDRIELAAALAEGQTIADVAAAQGVALDTLVDAAIAARAEFLTQAVAEGRFTQAQVDAMLATMRANITAQLSATHSVTGSGVGAGQGYVDADGDGVCDYGATRQAPGRGGRWSR